ncbi:MAG: hypothetical protein ACI85Q_001968 [Salibacteraceae bacterium]|jgi:hypothetical protein
MALKRLKINNETDAFVLAISCHQKSIKLAWEINRAINCDLRSSDIYENNIYFVHSVEGFPYFNWTNPDNRFTIHLIGNRSETSLLVPHQKQIDYYFVMTGFYEELDFEEGVKKIKQIPSVLTAFPVVLDKIKQ